MPETCFDWWWRREKIHCRATVPEWKTQDSLAIKKKGKGAAIGHITVATICPFFRALYFWLLTIHVHVSRSLQFCWFIYLLPSFMHVIFALWRSLRVPLFLMNSLQDTIKQWYTCIKGNASRMQWKEEMIITGPADSRRMLCVVMDEANHQRTQ